VTIGCSRPPPKVLRSSVATHERPFSSSKPPRAHPRCGADFFFGRRWHVGSHARMALSAFISRAMWCMRMSAAATAGSGTEPTGAPFIRLPLTGPGWRRIRCRHHPFDDRTTQARHQGNIMTTLHRPFAFLAVGDQADPAHDGAGGPRPVAPCSTTRNMQETEQDMSECQQRAGEAS